VLQLVFERRHDLRWWDERQQRFERHERLEWVQRFERFER
jgi:hypothetical protein